MCCSFAVLRSTLSLDFSRRYLKSLSLVFQALENQGTHRRTLLARPGNGDLIVISMLSDISIMARAVSGRLPSEMVTEPLGCGGVWPLSRLSTYFLRVCIIPRLSSSPNATLKMASREQWWMSIAAEKAIPLASFVFVRQRPTTSSAQWYIVGADTLFKKSGVKLSLDSPRCHFHSLPVGVGNIPSGTTPLRKLAAVGERSNSSFRRSKISCASSRSVRTMVGLPENGCGKICTIAEVCLMFWAACQLQTSPVLLIWLSREGTSPRIPLDFLLYGMPGIGLGRHFLYNVYRRIGTISAGTSKISGCEATRLPTVSRGLNMTEVLNRRCDRPTGNPFLKHSGFG